MVIGQNLLDQAMKAYQDQDYKNAMKLIEATVASEQSINDPYAWHLKGYIYKDYFKKVENEVSTSENRLIAIQAYVNSKQLDTKNEYIENNLGNIKYLAVSYYNDAVRNMDTVNYKKAEDFYSKYKEYYLLFDPTMNYNKADVSFYNALATVSAKKYDSKNLATDKYFDETINTYKKVLDIDSAECFANEQMGILYYNKGVDLIMNIDIENIDPSEILKKQDECNEYWKVSLPYLLRAYRHCPGTPEEKFTIIEGIKGIYWGMDMKENFDLWDKVQKKTDPNGDK
jgi:tetratricopeptide (TPR) repeat protein